MSTFFTIIVILIVILGVVMLIKTLRAKDFDGDADTLEYKDGLPILSRDKRPTLSLLESSDEQPSQDGSGTQAAKTLQIVAGDLSETGSESKDALSSLAQVAQHSTPESAQDTTSGDTDTKQHGRFTEPDSTFSQNSPILDRHLSEQQTFDQNNDPLLHAQDTVTIVIVPKDQYNGISGKAVLEIARAYGLKYGVMNMYHRYEHQDSTGDLWFSMIGVNHEGVTPFNLNTLTDNNFLALSLFLSLPHPHALRGFDSMVSVAQSIATELGAELVDEDNYLLDTTQLAKIRASVADY